MLFGCEDNKRINKALKFDNPDKSKYFGLPRWADQSVVSDTFRKLTAENIEQLEAVWQESLKVTGVLDLFDFEDISKRYEIISCLKGKKLTLEEIKEELDKKFGNGNQNN